MEGKKESEKNVAITSTVMYYRLSFQQHPSLHTQAIRVSLNPHPSLTLTAIVSPQKYCVVDIPYSAASMLLRSSLAADFVFVRGISYP